MQKSDFYKTVSQCVSKEYCDGYNAAVDDLIDAGFKPTRHAHWIDFYWYGDILGKKVEICAKKCSYCCTLNKNVSVGDYCLWCGSKMDEDDEKSKTEE